MPTSILSDDIFVADRYQLMCISIGFLNLQPKRTKTMMMDRRLNVNCFLMCAINIAKFIVKQFQFILPSKNRIKPYRIYLTC